MPAGWRGARDASACLPSSAATSRCLTRPIAIVFSAQQLAGVGRVVATLEELVGSQQALLVLASRRATRSNTRPHSARVARVLGASSCCAPARPPAHSLARQMQSNKCTPGTPVWNSLAPPNNFQCAVPKLAFLAMRVWRQVRGYRLPKCNLATSRRWRQQQ